MDKVTFHKNREGYGIVEVYYRPPFEDMFETLTFAGKFESMNDAKRLVERVKKAMNEADPHPLEALDMRYWIWSPSPCSPLGFMHEKCATKPHVVPESNWSKSLIGYND